MFNCRIIWEEKKRKKISYLSIVKVKQLPIEQKEKH